MEVFSSARTRVLPKQQVIHRQLAISVALTLRQQLLHSKHQGQCISTQSVKVDTTVSTAYSKRKVHSLAEK